MSTEQLLKTVLASLDDGKGNDIQVIDVQGKTSVADFMVIASGTSERHVKFLADQVIAVANYVSFNAERFELVLFGGCDDVVGEEFDMSLGGSAGDHHCSRTSPVRWPCIHLRNKRW